MDELLGFDWRKAWIDYNASREPPGDASYWDARAKEFAHYAGTSSYGETFINYLDLAPKQSVLDMGCGSGTLALPLAGAGHRVLAADFSEKMLTLLKQTVTEQELHGIRVLKLDFNAPWEEWEAAGLSEDSVDVAIASRSTMVKDLWEAFEKLERVARTKVAMTLSTEFGPRETRQIGTRADGASSFLPDSVFALNVLFQMGRHPELRYIDSPKKNSDGSSRLIRWAFLTWHPPQTL
ncbi:MAG: methyltransferase domain-containing protein [Coriobacteriales bacterium]|jgi:cyclopropane fatty-acyl-phospholipid synthase-like methyltransferase|nr:methyltransferase domain-containing protein [Coriobacteriales bacterium]